MIPNNAKDKDFNLKKRDKFLERNQEIIDKRSKQIIIKAKRFQNQLKSLFDEKDLNDLYDSLTSEKHWWAFIELPESKKEDKTFLLAQFYMPHKRLFLASYEDLPLYVGSNEDIDKIVKWRLSVGGFKDRRKK